MSLLSAMVRKKKPGGNWGSGGPEMDEGAFRVADHLPQKEVVSGAPLEEGHPGPGVLDGHGADDLAFVAFPDADHVLPGADGLQALLDTGCVGDSFLIASADGLSGVPSLDASLSSSEMRAQPGRCGSPLHYVF